MPSPDRVEIEIAPAGQGCLLIRYTDAGAFCGDTWHESLEAAFAQASYEYGLQASDFLAADEGRSGDEHGSAE